MPRWSRVLLSILAPLAILVALLSWGVSSPAGSSPDDDYHMASIWCAQGVQEGRCEQGPAANARLLPTDLLTAADCFAFKPAQAASCPRDEDSMRLSTRGNWADRSYPPVFYAVMSVFVGPDLNASILLMRAFNAILYVGVGVALFALLPRRRRPLLVATAAISVVPLGMFLIPSVNPSSWAIVSATGLWLAALGFFETRGRRRWLLGALSVVLLVIGAGARSDSAVYGAVALAAAVVLAFRWSRRYLWGLVLPVALVVVAAFFFLSAGQSAVVTGGTVVENTQWTFSELFFIDAKQLPQLLAGAFGVWGLGWLDTYLPGVVWVGALVLFGAMVFTGIRVGNARKWIALAGVGVCVVAVPLYILLHDGVEVGVGVQPRYIYPLLIVFGGVALVGLARTSLGLGRVQLLVAAIVIALANSIALHVNIRRYVTGTDRAGINLDRDIEWWWNAPLSPMGLWVIGTLAFAACAASIVIAAWRAAGVIIPSLGEDHADPDSPVVRAALVDPAGRSSAAVQHSVE